MPNNPASSLLKLRDYVVVFYPGVRLYEGTTNVVILNIKDLFECDAGKMFEFHAGKIKDPQKFTIRDKHFTSHMSCTCVSYGSGGSPCVYLSACLTNPDEEEPACKYDLNLNRGVFKYDLLMHSKYTLLRLDSGLDDFGVITKCSDSKHGFIASLVVQFNQDRIFVLSCDSDTFGPYFLDVNRPLKIIFQEYNVKEDLWKFVDCSTSIIDTCSGYIHDDLNHVPHVLIGSKLHVSLGNASFTFDVVNCLWQKCKLFDKFWSEQERKQSGLSPSDFYGYTVYSDYDEYASKKSNGGPLFGFYGKGSLYDEDILLGVHYAEDCPVVAFLLDDDADERVVVKSQRITEEELKLPNSLRLKIGRLVNLGGPGGYFGLLHNIDNEMPDFGVPDRRSFDPFSLQLTIFMVSRLSGDADQFLHCEFVDRVFVAENFYEILESC